MKTIGVLALQGDFEAHFKILGACGVASRGVKSARDLDVCDALILPGGESTAMARACDRFGLWEPLSEFACADKPLFGTCAGLILLARDLEGAAKTFPQRTLGVLDVAVARNAYGAQIESFEADVPVPMLGENASVRAMFIRAPQITRVGASVETLAEYANRPVLVRRGRVWASAFHPEIAGEPRLHQAWLDSF